MGLLTDPSAGQSKLTKALVKHHMKLCILLYLGGIVWFCLLAYNPLNAATYFSENALLPGLVKSRFREDTLAKQLHNELLDEMKKYDDSIPYSWLLAKFQQMGLDTYTHNFTLNYPFGKPHKYTGKNVYAILRAARAASTEALVMSVPYRPPKNIHPTTSPSIAIMLAFAKFANKENYWSKDIIFIVSEHEQLGMQAWLEAYHNVECGQVRILDHGDLRGRGGAIQAAINLEFHDVNIEKIDIKLEGLNGQLPNLDLFNLASRLTAKEGLVNTFKNKESRSFRDPIKEWNRSFRTLMSMVFSQSTGVPNGNHGLFHRFGIQALTMEGFPPRKNQANQSNFLTTGRILEGIFRSLNNLLERFHQSYFFYLLPSPERFISIGLYMPAICLIAGALFIKACGRWCQLQQTSPTDSKDDASGDSLRINSKPIVEPNINIFQIGAIFLVTHTIGITIMNCPNALTKIGLIYGYNSELSIFGGFAIISIALLIAPVFVTMRSCYKSMVVLNVLLLLEFGTVLICISMHNFSLGLLTGAFYVPLILYINPSRYRIYVFTQRLLWLFAHPLVVLTAVVLINAFYTFTGEIFKENIGRGFIATQQAIVFSIIDSMVYSNWLYNVITCIMTPIWLCFWCVLFSPLKPKENDGASACLIKKND